MDDENLWRNEILFHWDRSDPSWRATELIDRLLLGGTPQTDLVVQPGSITSPWQPSVHPGVCDVCVTMSPISGPAAKGVLELRVPLEDRSAEPVDHDALRKAVAWALAQHRDGKRVLIRCHAGLNRSGLVAVPLMTWLDETLSFEDALDIARTKRHALVLCRPELEDAARTLARPGA